MDEYESILASLTNAVDEYDSSTYLTIEKLTTLLKTLSRGIYHLTVIHTQAGTAHNEVQHNFTGSAARGLIEADHKVPEYRISRKILDACNRVQSAMIMVLSILKKEI